MKDISLRAIIAVTTLLGATPMVAEAAANHPNIVVILTDDQGYADISLNPHHPKEVSTSNMDALAEDGVVFSQGYTSGHVCLPTRAGLMLGRYQQRVGVYSAGDGGQVDANRPATLKHVRPVSEATDPEGVGLVPGPNQTI